METKLIQGKSGLENDSRHSVLSGLAEFIPLRDESSTHFSIEISTSEVYRVDESSDFYTFNEFMGLLPFLHHAVNLLEAGMYDGLE
jgi:hypothetical protein